MPRNNAEQLGRLLHSTMAELRSIPVTPETQSRHAYLVNEGLQLQQRLGVVWDNPPAWEGVHRQMLELRQGVMSLRAAPFRTGDTRQGIPTPAPMLSGLFGEATPGQTAMTVTGVLVVVAAVGGVWYLMRANKSSGASLGNPHGLRLNLKNPKFPTARKAK